MFRCFISREISTINNQIQIIDKATTNIKKLKTKLPLKVNYFININLNVKYL